MISVSCEEAGHAADLSDEHPCLCALDGFLPIACQSAAATEPCKSAFDDPSAGQHLEALGGVGSLDDLQSPAPEADEGTAQFRPGIAAIREHVAQFWGPRGEAWQRPRARRHDPEYWRYGPRMRSGGRMCR